MRHLRLLLLFTFSFFLASCGADNTQEEVEKSTKSTSTSNNPINTYMDSRVNAIESAKASVLQSNEKVEEQNKAMNDLLGK